VEIIKPSLPSISKVVSVLKNGGLVVFPCETVYGIAVDSENKAAIAKLNEYKQRPIGKPYAIMCSSKKMAEKYVILNKTAENLYKKFLPGPVTIVSKGKGVVANGVESELGSLGVRIPDYKYMTDIIGTFKRPIVATSANASYKKRPYKIDDILDNISLKQKGLIDLIIDAGELPHNEPSTVIDTTLDDKPVVLRQGEIVVTGKNKILSRSEENTQNLGKELWQKYEDIRGQRAIIFALQGKMGAGKTQFTKGVGRAMNIKDTIVSPTYALENEYESGLNKLFHFDVWRLEKSEDLKTLGFENLITSNSVIVVEWAEKVVDMIKSHQEDAIVVWVKIDYGKVDNERVISWGVLK